MRCKICGKPAKRKTCSKACAVKWQKIKSREYYLKHKEALLAYAKARYASARYCHVCGKSLQEGKICPECRAEKEKLGISVEALKVRRFSGFKTPEDMTLALRQKQEIIFGKRLKVVVPPCEIVELEDETHTRGVMRRMR